jgi:hypothetical protein
MKAGSDNFITVCDTHEAIISHELFDSVQTLLDSVAEASKNRKIDPYTMNPLKARFSALIAGQTSTANGTSEKRATMCISTIA